MVNSIMSDQIQILEERPKEEKCKGLFFRGYSSTFWKDGRLETREGYRMLIGMSCTGCPQCDWFSEYIGEEVAGDGPLRPKQVKHGKLYSIRMNVTEPSGYCPDYDSEMEIFEVGETTEKENSHESQL